MLGSVLPVMGIGGLHGKLLIGRSGTQRQTRPNSTAATLFGKRGDGDGEFSRPRDISIDNAGRMYITDSQNEHIDVFKIG